jgi:tRNA (mo5U34)-methyltransferase
MIPFQIHRRIPFVRRPFIQRDQLIRERNELTAQLRQVTRERDAARTGSLSPKELYEGALKVGWWFHSVDLGDGYYTPGLKSKEQMAGEAEKWEFPANLTGKTVLDIGCADGAYSVLALKRGAKSVLAIDEQITGALAFLLEARAFSFEFRNISLFSDEFMMLPKFDFVIFAGVLYHTQDPMLALNRVYRVTGGSALIETHVNGSLGNDRPCIVFYEGNELNNDWTNWVGPNPACVEAMLRTAGFVFRRTTLVYATPDNGRASYIAEPKKQS